MMDYQSLDNKPDAAYKNYNNGLQWWNRDKDTARSYFREAVRLFEDCKLTNVPEYNDAKRKLQ
ncbi:hypothetical protein SD81_036615 [Tolypothrix campylonemoides VB511288]|nr:hypothetical protein SD81_036615 [Tolypothrix campylonemoides VB511288]